MIELTNIQRKSFFSAVLFGFFAYGYMITNKITSNDDLGVLYGAGGGIVNGRWMTELYSNVFQTLNTPWVNGVLFIFILAVSVAIIVDIFQIKNNLAAVSVSAIWMVFPSSISILFYMFTAVPYALGILFAVLAVWVTVKKNGMWAAQAAVLCMVLSLGFYQAYYAAAAGMLLTILLLEIIFGYLNAEQILKRAFLYFGILAESMLLYLCLQKLLMRIFHITLTDYNNLDKMGRIDVEKLPEQILDAYNNFLHFWETVMESSKIFVAADYGICVLLAIFFAGYIGWILYKKKWFHAVFVFLIMMLFPLTCNLVYLYGAEGVHSLMCLGNVNAVILLICVVDCADFSRLKVRIWKIEARSVISAMVIVFSLHNCVISSRIFLQQEHIVNASIHYLSSVSVQIKCMQEYQSGMPVAFVGICDDPGLMDIDKMYRHTGMTGENTMWQIVNTVIRWDWCRETFFKVYAGFSAQFMEWEFCEQFKEDERIQNMPVYPSAGSIAVIDGIAVVHFS